MLEVKGLRTEFVRWLEENTQDPAPRVTAKEAVFAYYHDIGMPFAAILRDEASMDAGEALLAEHLGKVGRADPQEEARRYRGCWVKFRAFLEATDRLGLLEDPAAETANEEDTNHV